MSEQEDRMLKWFAHGHLRKELQDVAGDFSHLAYTVCATIDPGPERTVCLRKLLEAKDAAVRARLVAGG